MAQEGTRHADEAGGSAPLDALDRLDRSKRRLLGITGPPGAGKSTVAATLVARWVARGGMAVVVPMDGFHLSGGELVRRGLTEVKGAPETFDAGAFVSLLRRLRQPSAGDVAVPGFDRDRERTVPGALVVPANTDLVVVEGNYLLCDGGFAPVRRLLDLCWYVDVPDELRVPRLVARHVAHGRSPSAAEEWVHRSDEANARLVAATRHRADAVWDPQRGRLRPPG